MTRVKICGITRQVDAERAIELGADALGFIFESSSPRFLPSFPTWITSLPPLVTLVQVFGNAPISVATEHFGAVQGADWLEHSEVGWAKRIAAVRIKADDTVESALERGMFADAIVLDAYSPSAFGGTGKTIDWGLAREIVLASTKKVILAGGLNAANVGEAIRIVRPYAVDVSSGVESSPGIKDHAKMQAFIKEAFGA